MMEIKILGPGCSKCKVAADLVERVVKDRGIMMTPGIVVNGRLVHSGSVPRESDILSWTEGEQ